MAFSSFFSLIITLFSHGSQFDANQLLNIFLPFSKNPEQEEGRICIFQPTQKYALFVLNLLKLIFAVCKRMNKLMRDTSDSTSHIDSCKGKALFEALKTCNTHTIKGRTEIRKLLFDNKAGAIGGISEDVNKFNQLYPKESIIFKKVEDKCGTTVNTNISLNLQKRPFNNLW